MNGLLIRKLINDTMIGYQRPAQMLPRDAMIAVASSGSMPPNQPLPM